MEIIGDAVLALLSAVGLWTLARMLLRGLWKTPPDANCLLIVKASGDGKALEPLLTDRGAAKLMILDCGLTKYGRRLCELTLKQNTNTSIYHVSEQEMWTKEAIEWTKRKI